MAARVFTKANNKGGVTKTTSTVNTAIGYAKLGKQVLLLDLDPQSNSTWTLLHKVYRKPKDTIYEALLKRRPLHELIVPTWQENLYTIPASLWLSYAEAKLLGKPYSQQMLRNLLKPYLSKFDYIFIDTPPSLGLLTVNAVFAGTDIIIPITLNGYSMVGISILLNMIKELKKSAEENGIPADMSIFGVLVSRVQNNNEAKQYLREVEQYFGDLVFEQKIPENVDVERANNLVDSSLYDTYRSSSGAKAYAGLVGEMIAREAVFTLDSELYHARTKRILDELEDPDDEGDEEEFEDAEEA